MIKQIPLLLLSAIVCLAVGCNNKAEDDKTVLRQTVEKMNEHVMKEEFQQVIGYMHPESFQTFTAAEMLEGFKGSMHNENYDMKVKEFIVDSVSKVYPTDTSKFAVVAHHAIAEFHIKVDSTKSKADQENEMNQNCINMKTILGDKYVTCHLDERNIDVMMPDRTYFIYSPSRKKWLAVLKSNQTALDKLIPADIKAKLDR